MSSQLIEQVKLHYKQSLIGKAENLSKLWKSSENNPDELLSFLHQLSGSAGMYGYDAITDHSAKLRSKIQSDGSLNLYQNDFQKLHKLLVDNSR